MSGDAIVLCSLITSLPAGLVLIMSANSQLSSALLSSLLPCPQLASLPPQKKKKYSSQQIFHSGIKTYSSVFTTISENVCQHSFTVLSVQLV